MPSYKSQILSLTLIWQRGILERNTRGMLVVRMSHHLENGEGTSPRMHQGGKAAETPFGKTICTIDENSMNTP